MLPTKSKNSIVKVLFLKQILGLEVLAVSVLEMFCFFFYQQNWPCRGHPLRMITLPGAEINSHFLRVSSSTYVFQQKKNRKNAKKSFRNQNIFSSPRSLLIQSTPSCLCYRACNFLYDAKSCEYLMTWNLAWWCAAGWSRTWNGSLSFSCHVLKQDKNPGGKCMFAFLRI